MSLCGINSCDINGPPINACCDFVFVLAGLGVILTVPVDDRSVALSAPDNSMMVTADNRCMAIPDNDNQMWVLMP